MSEKMSEVEVRFLTASYRMVIKILIDNVVSFADRLPVEFLHPNLRDEYEYMERSVNIEGKLPHIPFFRERFSRWDMDEFAGDVEGASFSECMEDLNECRMAYELFKLEFAIQTLDQMESPASHIFEMAQRIVSEVKTFRGISARMYGEDLDKEIKERVNKSVYLSTGFSELDDMIGGFDTQQDEFAVILGRFGRGKTWLLLKSAMENAVRGYRIGFISPEMSYFPLEMRLDAVRHHINLHSVFKGKLTEDEMVDYLNYRHSIIKSGIRLYMADTRSFGGKVTLSQINAFIRQYKLQGLYIDGIRFLKLDNVGRYVSTLERYEIVSDYLHNLSLTLGLPIICVVQSNRDGFRDDKDRMADALNIKGSDDIGATATTILSVDYQIREDSANGNYRISVEKSRNDGVRGKVGVVYDACLNLGKFEFSGYLDKAKVIKSGVSSDRVQQKLSDKSVRKELENHEETEDVF